MPCTRPLTAYQDAEGRVVFNETDGVGPPLSLACGQCQDCRLQRSADWATRITHEAQLHERNSFLTLTYSDEHLPADSGLSQRDFQLFMKRLRSEVGKVRYYACGEYGEQTFRPHYHLCLFGEDFSEDRELVSQNHQGDRVYKSDWLDWIWKKGGCRIGNLTPQSAAYVARYVMKKATGPHAAIRYQTVNSETGEVFAVESERAWMSLKPGIGADWFKRYGHTDVFPIDQVIINGGRRHVPRYYDKLWERQGGDLPAVKLARQERAERVSDDLTPERLAVRERCSKARLRKLTRRL